DVPLGAFLSGGIDLSLLVALMAKYTSEKRLKPFSVGFEPEGEHIHEPDHAQTTARFLGTDHSRVVVRGEDVRDRIEQIALALDQPTVDGVNSYFVSMVARRAVTVAISGTGGDELFAGYPWFTEMDMYEQQMEQNPQSITERVFSHLAEQPLFDPYLYGRWRNVLSKARDKAGFLARYADT